jgi:hypothetical protein
MLIAMLARVPESMWSMRWPIGWPIVICVPGTAASAARSSSSTVVVVILEVQPHVDLGRVRALRVLVQLRAARAARRLLDGGVREQDLLHAPAHRVRLGERGARHRERADHQRALVELGQEGSPEQGHDEPGGSTSAAAPAITGSGLRSTGSSVRAYRSLQRAHDPALLLRLHRLRAEAAGRPQSAGVTVSATTSDARIATM